MGTHLSKTKLTPPKVIDQIRSGELHALISHRLKPDKLRISDHHYDIYSVEDLRRFLDEMALWIPTMPQENLALQLLGREKVWYAEAGVRASSTFGYITGDIRLPEDPYIERLTTANFFVDEQRQIWIVEPRTGRIYQPTLCTQIDFAII